MFLPLLVHQRPSPGEVVNKKGKYDYEHRLFEAVPFCGGMRGKDEAGIQIIPGVLSSKTGGKVCRGRSIAPCCQTAEIRLFSCSALRLQEVSPWIPRTIADRTAESSKRIDMSWRPWAVGTLTDAQAEEGCSAPCHRSGDGSRAEAWQQAALPGA